MVLETKNLIIRQFEKTDDADLLEAMECPLVHQMYSNGFTAIDKVQGYIQLLLQEYQSGKVRTLAVAEKSSNKLIGSITLDVLEFFARAEISYWINKSYRNMGYATEVVKAITAYCFDALSLNRVQALTSNPASERVLKKSGMIYEGTLRQYFKFGDTSWDVKMYAILKEDYSSAKDHNEEADMRYGMEGIISI